MGRQLLSTVAGISILALARAEDGTFDSNGVTIRYVTAGAGEPVVLIHGWMSDATMWGQDSNRRPKLKPAPGFRFIALDCRGHGESDKPHESDRYGPEMAVDVVRLLDHLKIKKAHLVGYSMGCFIAAKVAATHPSRVLSLVLGGQAPLLAGRPWTDAREVEVFVKAVEADRGLGAYLLEIWPKDRPRPTPQAADAIAKIQFGGKDTKAWAAAALSFRHLRVSNSELRRFRAPVLFLYGSKEPDSTKDAVARSRQVLGRGEIKVIEGADHGTTLLGPEFGKTILEFLSSVKNLPAAPARPKPHCPWDWPDFPGEPQVEAAAWITPTAK